VPLRLVLARLDQALELVRVAGEARLGRVLALVVVDQPADGLTDRLRELGDLVGGDLWVRRRDHIALSHQGDVADAGILGVVEQAEQRGAGRVGALDAGQQVADDRGAEAVPGDALGVVDAGDQPASRLAAAV
jgi:hypothetical protein